jgi:hypothetical protein
MQVAAMVENSNTRWIFLELSEALKISTLCLCELSMLPEEGQREGAPTPPGARDGGGMSTLIKLQVKESDYGS